MSNTTNPSNEGHPHEGAWEPIPFYDPHFHIWSCVESEAAAVKYPDPEERQKCCMHSLDTLGGAGERFPMYTLQDYESHMEEACGIPAYPAKGTPPPATSATVDMAFVNPDHPQSASSAASTSNPASITTPTDTTLSNSSATSPPPHTPWAKHVGGVFVEALPNDERALDEVCWVAEELARNPSHRKYQIVARANFSKMGSGSDPAVAQTPWTAEAQRQLNVASGSEVRPMQGVRQILNHEPSWPFITHDLLQDAEWIERVKSALKETRDVAGTPQPCIPVFELHANPHQFLLAVEHLVRPNPQTKFVLNHLGTKRPEDSEEMYWKGIRAMAACPNAYVKLSDPPYISAGHSETWDTDPYVVQLTHRLIDQFGPDRCMVASNYPVTFCTGATPQRLFLWLQNKVFAPESGFTRVDIEKMMAGTALRVYDAHVGGQNSTI